MDKYVLAVDWFESHISRAFNSHLFSCKTGDVFETEAFYTIPKGQESTIVGTFLNMGEKPQLVFIEVLNGPGYEHPMMRLFTLIYEHQFQNESLPLGAYTGTISILNFGNKSSVTLARELIGGALREQAIVSSHERNFALMARLYLAN